MRLRNKNTGEIGVLEATTYHGGRPDNIVEVYEMGMGGAVKVLAQYNTLEELLEEWEDHIPDEPLIKDEKVRKAVLAWAESLKSFPEKVMYNAGDFSFCTDISGIEFDVEIFGIETGYHTIAELCGEEEE